MSGPKTSFEVVIFSAENRRLMVSSYRRDVAANTTLFALFAGYDTVHTAHIQIDIFSCPFSIAVSFCRISL